MNPKTLYLVDERSSTDLERPPKIVVRDLWMAFAESHSTAANRANSVNRVPVLENINLQVPEGEFICIVGPSGCGKSTLLNIIGGFLKASKGEVLIDGARVEGPNLKRIFIFQENAIFPWLTVEENIGAGLLDRPARERREIVAQYMDMVGLTDFARSYPRQISGGMKQRVEIARALAANPDVLYMDEPFGALDFLTRLRMRSELIEIWQREKKTILFVTHDIEESVQLADRVVVMSRRPATIVSTIKVNMPRPRDLDSPEYLGTRDEIFEIMGLDHAGLSVDSQANESKVEPATANAVARCLKTKKLDADVIIIGGGPAGSALGVHLAGAGIDHLIIDKAHHPRAHVGESLSNSTTKLLEEIGMLPLMEREQFGVKRGVSWTTWDSPEQIDIDFKGLGEFDYSYQVDRAKFDDLLLRQAREKGSRVFSGAQVDRVDFDRNGVAIGVTVKVGGSRFPLRSRLVVDASGRRALIGGQLKLMKSVVGLPQFSVHSWFTGVDRGRKETSGNTHIHLLPVRRGWAWQIPIDAQVTSIGIVLDREYHVKSGERVDQFFDWVIRMNPILNERMQGACRLREFRMDGNYSYLLEQFAGDGWLAVGDAAFFVDPIFSAGISDALHSAKFAAEAIKVAAAGGDFRRTNFSAYEERIQRGANAWFDFVNLFYEAGPVFSRVMTGHESRTAIIRLCEGNVYDNDNGESVSETIESLKRTLEAIRGNPEHRLYGQLAKAAW